MIAVATAVGYLIGSLPTAQGLGRLWGVDLMSQGSRNPGTTNALRLAGPSLGIAVLLVEVAKGAAAVLAGEALADEWGAVAAGVSAVAGNAYSVWLGWKGGKGLGISLGVLLTIWPLVVPVVVVVIALTALLTRSSGLAAVLALIALFTTSLIWLAAGWSTGGVGTAAGSVVVAAGIGALIGPKHWRYHRIKQSGNLGYPESS